mgnify:CR=1 FL=1
MQQNEKRLKEQLQTHKEDAHRALKAAEQNLKHKTAEMGRILHRHIKNSLAVDADTAQGDGRHQKKYVTTEADMQELKEVLVSGPRPTSTPKAHSKQTRGFSSLESPNRPKSPQADDHTSTATDAANRTDERSPGSLSTFVALASSQERRGTSETRSASQAGTQNDLRALEARCAKQARKIAQVS